MSDFIDRFEKDVAKYLHRTIRGRGIHWMDGYAKSRFLSEQWVACLEKIDAVATQKALSLDEIEYIIEKREHLNALFKVIDYIEKNPPPPIPNRGAEHNLDFKSWMILLEKCTDLGSLAHIKQVIEGLRGIMR